MSRVNKVIYHDDNEVYYSGLRSILGGTVYSMLGVYAYFLLVGELPLSKILTFQSAAVNAWILFCIFLWRRSYTKPNNVVFSLGTAKYIPQLAKVMVAVLAVTTGAFCSLLYDVFSNENVTVAKIVAFFIAAGIYMLSLFVFSSVSIKKVTTEAKAKPKKQD